MTLAALIISGYHVTKNHFGCWDKTSKEKGGTSDLHFLWNSYQGVFPLHKRLSGWIHLTALNMTETGGGGGGSCFKYYTTRTCDAQYRTCDAHFLSHIYCDIQSYPKCIETEWISFFSQPHLEQSRSISLWWMLVKWKPDYGLKKLRN